MMKRFSLLLLTVALFGSQCNGFIPQSNTQRNILKEPSSSCNVVVLQSSNKDEESSSVSRRHWMKSSFEHLMIAGGLLLSDKAPALAVMSVDQKVFTPGESLSVPASKERFVLARKDVQYLLDNYDSISKEGGDAVRRYLGTVGVTGAMYGISKVLKTLRDEAEDIVEYTEAMDEFNAYLYQAEGAAYQSIFAEFSSAKASPESCLATAKQDVVMMAKYMDKLQAQLGL